MLLLLTIITIIIRPGWALTSFLSIYGPSSANALQFPALLMFLYSPWILPYSPPGLGDPRQALGSPWPHWLAVSTSPDGADLSLTLVLPVATILPPSWH